MNANARNPLSQPPPKPPFDERRALGLEGEQAQQKFEAEQAAYHAAFAEWLSTIPENQAIVFQNGKQFSAVTRDPGGGWRTTAFDSVLEMPWGHEEYATRLEAARQLATWTRIEDLPFTVKPGEFHAARTPFLWLRQNGYEPRRVRFGGYLAGGETACVLDELTEPKEWFDVNVDDLSIRKPAPASLPAPKPAEAKESCQAVELAS